MTARCLETRRTPEGFRRRRYEQDGVRFTTIEVPLEAWLRATGVLAKKETAERLLRDGGKPLAVAAEVGAGRSTLQRWKKNLK